MSRALLLCALLGGYTFDLDRTASLGEIDGRALRAGGAAASHALVSLQGSARVTTAGADGSFVLAGLVPGKWFVRVSEDDDGDRDGQPDVTGPARCLGPGVGTDLDGDDLCEPAEDPFSSCATTFEVLT